VNAFWSYFWPVAAFGLVAGAVFATAAFRRRRRSASVAGLVAALAFAALWHWPLGAADRFRSQVETKARAVLVDWEMGQIQARLAQGPLGRRLVLSGPADDFQRGGLVRIMGAVPGVSSATWSKADRGRPLFAEAMLASIAGFLAGALLAYLADLRRRYNAQWRW